jgi:hypothetical protein
MGNPSPCSAEQPPPELAARLKGLAPAPRRIVCQPGAVGRFIFNVIMMCSAICFIAYFPMYIMQTFSFIGLFLVESICLSLAFVGYMMLRDDLRSIRLQRWGQPVIGKIVQSGYVFRYTYRDLSGVEHQGEESVIEDGLPPPDETIQINEGAFILILYDPHRPDRSTVAGWGDFRCW